MIGKAIRHRLFSLIAAAAILLSVTATAGAVPTSVEDAKDEIATKLGLALQTVYNKRREAIVILRKYMMK